MAKKKEVFSCAGKHVFLEVSPFFPPLRFTTHAEAAAELPRRFFLTNLPFSLKKSRKHAGKIFAFSAPYLYWYKLAVWKKKDADSLSFPCFSKERENGGEITVNANHNDFAQKERKRKSWRTVSAHTKKMLDEEGEKTRRFKFVCPHFPSPFLYAKSCYSWALSLWKYLVSKRRRISIMQSQALELTSLKMRKMSRGGGEIILRKKRRTEIQSRLAFSFCRSSGNPPKRFQFSQKALSSFPPQNSGVFPPVWANSKPKSLSIHLTPIIFLARPFGIPYFSSFYK